MRMYACRMGTPPPPEYEVATLSPETTDSQNSLKNLSAECQGHTMHFPGSSVDFKIYFSVHSYTF